MNSIERVLSLNGIGRNDVPFQRSRLSPFGDSIDPGTELMPSVNAQVAQADSITNNLEDMLVGVLGSFAKSANSWIDREINPGVPTPPQRTAPAGTTGTLPPTGAQRDNTMLLIGGALLLFLVLRK